MDFRPSGNDRAKKIPLVTHEKMRVLVILEKSEILVHKT